MSVNSPGCLGHDSPTNTGTSKGALVVVNHALLQPEAKNGFFLFLDGWRKQKNISRHVWDSDLSPRIVLMKQATCIPLRTIYSCFFATKTESLWQRPYDRKSIKYLLCGPWQKECPVPGPRPYPAAGQQFSRAQGQGVSGGRPGDAWRLLPAGLGKKHPGCGAAWVHYVGKSSNTPSPAHCRAPTRQQDPRRSHAHPRKPNLRRQHWLAAATRHRPHPCAREAGQARGVGGALIGAGHSPPPTSLREGGGAG